MITNLRGKEMMLVIILLLLGEGILCEVVIDHAGKFDDYACIKEKGYSQVIIRAYHSYGGIDL